MMDVRKVNNEFDAGPLDQPVTPDIIETLFKLILKRPVNDDDWKLKEASYGLSIAKYIENLRRSEELRRRVVSEAGATMVGPKFVDDFRFRIPENLAVSKISVKQVLLIGSCLLQSWLSNLEAMYKGVKFDSVVFNNGSKLPVLSEESAKSLDFQIVQIPIRSVMHEAAFFSLSATGEEGHKRFFDRCCSLLEFNYNAIMEYNSQFGVESYILGFYLPVQNPLGRLQARYNLSNCRYVVEELNRRLYELTQKSANAYFIDSDEIISTYGRKYFQDDFLLQSNHGSALFGVLSKNDVNRLEPAGSVVESYGIKIPKFIQAVFEEMLAARKTKLQTDSIKLVIFDLDDTLWRGVAAEMDDPSPEIIEGWPLGIIEAASAFWRRGILIAIASKNDESNVRAIWNKTIKDSFSLDKFVSLKINWNSKADNIEQILRETNLLPSSVLFVDDNPVERAAVKARFPEIRVLDAPLVEWKRILTWAPELQRATITEEAVHRSESTKAVAQREEERKTLGREEFLYSLGVKITPSIIVSTSDAKFERSFELLNKTNQFNTTGRRWSYAEISEFLAGGGKLLALNVQDIYTNYGLTGLLLIKECQIAQFVLSCRVFGMEVEQAGVALAAEIIAGAAEGFIRATDKNKLSQRLYQDLGFAEQGDGLWKATREHFEIPKHIDIVRVSA